MPLLVSVAYLAFIAIGLPDGILGVAWPSMRREFGVPLDALGLLLGFGIAGYMLSSFACGKLLNRMGIGTLLALCTWLAAASLLGFAVLPTFPTLLLAGCLAGLGGGAIDSALNTYAAFNFRPRTLNWLHACYSLGAFLGPMAVTAALAAERSWRFAYAGVALAQALLGLVFLVTRRIWTVPRTGPAGEAPGDWKPASYRETLARGPVWLGILAFFLYTGLEFSVGQWAYTLLLEGRGLVAGQAALWVSAYWAAFTGGRVLAGLLPLGDRVGLLLRLCPAGMVAGAALAALGGAGYPALAGLVLLGLAFAPVYPAMVSATPARLGDRHAANAMGFQVTAATAGLAAVPGLIGMAAERLGYEAIGRGWLLCAFLVLLCLAAVAPTVSPARLRKTTLSENS